MFRDYEFSWNLDIHQGLIQDFFHRGVEIIACNSVPKLGKSGGMLPQENFEIYNL